MSEKILVVDDMKNIAFLLKYILSKWWLLCLYILIAIL